MRPTELSMDASTDAPTDAPSLSSHRLARGLFASLASLVALASLPGCGDEALERPLADTAGIDASGDSVLNPDAAGADATAAVDSADATEAVDSAVAPPDTTAPPETAVGPTSVGVGVILGELDSAFYDAAWAAARLLRVVPPEDTSGTMYGPCRVTTVRPDAVEPQRYGLDAGVITITGTQPAVTLTPITEGVFGTGYSSSLPSDQHDLLPSGGAIVTVSAAGGAEVAAFTGVLQIPESVTIGLPATSLSATADVTRPMAVTWNSGTGDSVLVSMTPLSGTGELIAGPGAFCVVAGDPGQLTIPSEALRALVPTSSSQLVAFGVTRTRAGAATNADHRVPLTATRSSGGPLTLRVP